MPASQRIDVEEVVGPAAADGSVREVARAVGVAPAADQLGDALDGLLVAGVVVTGVSRRILPVRLSA